MSIAALVQTLLAAGVDHATVVAAVAAVERSVDEQAERRRAADRERKRESRLRNSADSADSADLPPEVSLSPAPLTLPNPPSKKTPKGVQKGSRLPADWTPSGEDVASAKAMGFSDAQAAGEFDRFRDYWLAAPGVKGVKLDWSATLRNWLRSTAERKGIAPAVPRSTTGPPMPPRKIYTDAELLADLDP